MKQKYILIYLLTRCTEDAFKSRSRGTVFLLITSDQFREHLTWRILSAWNNNSGDDHHDEHDNDNDDLDADERDAVYLKLFTYLKCVRVTH